MSPRGSLAVVVAATFMIGALAGAGAFALWRSSPGLAVGPHGALHSVMLANGQVYYGALEAAGGQALVLRDVHYIQTTLAPGSNERVNALVRRADNDWHGPSRMAIPLTQIVFVEAVGPDSRVARLVKEAKTELR